MKGYLYGQMVRGHGLTALDMQNSMLLLRKGEPHMNVKCGDDQVIRIDLHVPHYDAYIRLKRMIQELY